MASGGEGNHRMPRTAQDLLALAASYTDPNNPNENVSFNTMDPERREWLEKAMNDMTVNPPSEMRKCADCIIDDATDTDAKLDALDKLLEWCDHMDFAIDFHKIGGFEIFPKCASNDDPDVRSQALELVAIIVQNNPYCLKAVLDNKMLPELLQSLDNDTSLLVRRKALYAISCLVREFPEALDAFIQNDGFSSLMRAIQTGDEKIKIKAAFLISGVCTNNNSSKDILCDMGMIQQLVGHLSEEHSTFHEHLLSALLTVVRDHPRSLQECCQSELGLQALLQQKREDLKGQEEFQEEYEYAGELMNLLKTNEDTDNNVAR